MKKKALLVYGTPKSTEDSGKFYGECNRDIGIMAEIVKTCGYDFDTVHDLDLETKLGEYASKDIDSFLFYFTDTG